jgi:putative mycofactocin binding protein MftB
MAAAGDRIELHPACRVRQEGFGLLFYDLRGPRLLFVETGSLVSPELFSDQETAGRKLARFGKNDRSRVISLLNKLREKGYLREQPIC